MFDEVHHLSTRAYLEEVKKQFPNDPRLEVYEELQPAVSKIDPLLFVTITFASKVSDEVSCEGICRRITYQLQRAVAGKRTKTKVPFFVVLERSKSKALHVHTLIGRVQGSTRTLESTTFKHYTQKQLFPSLIKILHRLTFPDDKNRTCKVGVCDIKSVNSKEGAVDYLLKAMKPKRLNVAWLASYLDFSTSSAPVRPLRPERPKVKKRKAHTQTKRSLKVP